MYINSLRHLSCLIRTQIRENIINNNTISNYNKIYTIENNKPFIDKYNGDDWLLFKYLINLHQPKLDKLSYKNKLNYETTLSKKNKLDNKIYYMNKKFYLEKKEKNYYKLKLPYTDYNDMFNMYIIKWSPGSLSPIHNHPELGCIMRILEGDVLEKKYDHDIKLESEILLSSNKDYDINLKTTYIDDSQNYHSISNISKKPAYTLHIYGYNPLNKHKIRIFDEPFNDNINYKYNQNKKQDFNLLRYIMN